MFDNAAVMGFIPARDFERARRFYVDLLGLTFLADDGFALEVKSGGTHIRIARVSEFTPLPFTLLGWRVNDIVPEVRALTAKGIVFERYSWLPQDESGIWTAPDGSKVAWFRDPDGNILSLSQHMSAEIE